MTEADISFVNKYGDLVTSHQFDSDFIKNMLISMKIARPQQEQNISFIKTPPPSTISTDHSLQAL